MVRIGGLLLLGDSGFSRAFGSEPEMGSEDEEEAADLVPRMMVSPLMALDSRVGSSRYSRSSSSNTSG